MTPVYLLQMYKLKDKDADIWEFFMNGYFSINKISVPLTATGADHAIEHENRTMKVLGGIKGIANGIKILENISSLPQKLIKQYKTFVRLLISKITTAKELLELFLNP